MFPPPITTATSRPPARSWASSLASSSTVCASRPKSAEPMRASPETFSRTRLNANVPLPDRVPGVVEELDTLLGEVLADGRGRLVGAVPRLLREHGLAVELLVQLPFDDLVAHVLRLRLHLVGVGEDLALRVDELLRDLRARAVRRAGERQVQGETARDGGVAALRAHERADLVRRPVHVVREYLVAIGLHPLRARDLDVLAEPGCELHALVLERRRIAAVEHGAQHLLGVREEIVVVRHRLGLAADRGDRADAVAHHHADLALARLAVRALRGGRHAFLAQQLDGLVEVASGLLERALALHHPGARRVAELLDHRGGDLA